MGKVSQELKKNILLNSFEKLKNNYEKHKESYKDIIGRMSAIDKELALEMWIWLLKQYHSHVVDSRTEFITAKAYDLTEAVTSEIADAVGKEAMAAMVVGNTYIKDILFGQSGSVFTRCLFGMRLSGDHCNSDWTRRPVFGQ